MDFGVIENGTRMDILCCDARRRKRVRIRLESLRPQSARGARAAPTAPFMGGHCVASIAGQGTVPDQVHQNPPAQLLGERPSLGLVYPHEWRIENESPFHAEVESNLKRLDRVVSTVGITGKVGLADTRHNVLQAAAVRHGGSEREKNDVSSGNERVRQA